MELWGWLVGYVALFALLHVVLYYVSARRDEEDDGGDSRPVTDSSHATARFAPGPDSYPQSSEYDVDPPDHSHDIDGESIRCPHCGVENAADSTFTYCWHCLSTLRR